MNIHFTVASWTFLPATTALEELASKAFSTLGGKNKMVPKNRSLRLFDYQLTRECSKLVIEFRNAKERDIMKALAAETIPTLHRLPTVFLQESGLLETQKDEVFAVIALQPCNIQVWGGNTKLKADLKAGDSILVSESTKFELLGIPYIGIMFPAPGLTARRERMKKELVPIGEALAPISEVLSPVEELLEQGRAK